MIKNAKLLKKWETKFQLENQTDFFQNLQIYEALYKEAQFFGVLPAQDPLEGIDFKIKFAKALNVSGIAKKIGKSTLCGGFSIYAFCRASGFYCTENLV